jgi:hypothetical protein
MSTVDSSRREPLAGSPAGMKSSVPFLTVAMASNSFAKRERKLASDSPVWST